MAKTSAYRLLQRRLLSVLLACAATWWGPAAASRDMPTPAVPAAPILAPHLNPEAATAWTDRRIARAQHHMIATANTWASQAGERILAEGGSAADAVIAAQMVLNLVEPQSSGIGGGAFIVSFDGTNGKVQSYDGRETAPAAARSNRFMQAGRPLEFWDAVNNGRSVGVPGLVRVLALMHKQHGRLPWARLFEPAIQLATTGFPVSERLNALLLKDEYLPRQAAAAAYFYDAEGKPWPVGHVLKNAALARTLRDLADKGPDAFYNGPVAHAIVAAVASHPIPGDLSLADMSRYAAIEREPLCTPYKGLELCGAPPPSAGPLAVMQMLKILGHTLIADLPPDSLQAVHYFSEAGKLAFADRDVYLADPDFIDVPTQALLDDDYLAARAALIRPDRSLGRAPPGDPVEGMAELGQDDALELPSTTHVVAVDIDGSVVSMTSTIESAFGSKILVNGFLLNNELTDFSLSDVDAQGKPIANRVEPLKRPRSSMAPMLVLKEGRPVLALGSPGGSAIINYVAKTLLGVLEWDLNIQEAIDLPNRGSRNSFTELEKNTDLHVLASGLRAMGHAVREIDFPSGVQGVLLGPDGLQGGADPRREGSVLGR